MKWVVGLLLALPCLSEPDIFSYSPFLNQYIWSAEPAAPYFARGLYQYRAPYALQPWSRVVYADRFQGFAAPSVFGSSLPQARTVGVQKNIQSTGPAITASITNIIYPAAVPAVKSIVETPGSTSPLNVIEDVLSQPHLHKIGEIPARKPEMHPMKGTVLYNEDNESQIIVRGFTYPSPGPDAFFWAGEDEPSCSEESISGRNYLLAPGQVGSTDYFNENQPILPAYSGDQGDLVLTLPPGVSVRNLKWLCVWCRKFTQNFGTLKMNL